MIKLDTMQAVVATVNDQWESDLADAILARWEHDPVRAKYWRASANFVFFFKRLGQDCILRFNHENERSVEMIQAELDYVKTVAAQGLRVAQPLPSCAGNDVERVDTSLGRFHAVAFEKMPGKQLDLAELTPDQLARWGQALGEVHNCAAHYTRPGRPTWQDHVAFVAATLSPDDYVARRALDKLNAALAQLPVNPQNFGLIHFDFELDNIIWDDEQPGIIDFDDCARYWFVADIAFALRDLFADRAANVNSQDEAVQHFARGYARVRPIAAEELALMPTFLRLHHLVMYGRLARALTPPHPNGEPTWMTELRHKLAAKMQLYRAEFSA